MADWEPVTEAEQAMRDALSAKDQESYFRILADVELMLPISADAVAGRVPMGWGTWSAGGRTHILAFTSAAALQACLADHAGSARRVTYRELASSWPNIEWWLAVNPGLPIEGYLPSWFLCQSARGDFRLPVRGSRASVGTDADAATSSRAVADAPDAASAHRRSEGVEPAAGPSAAHNAPPSRLPATGSHAPDPARSPAVTATDPPRRISGPGVMPSPTRPPAVSPAATAPPGVPAGAVTPPGVASPGVASPASSGPLSTGSAGPPPGAAGPLPRRPVTPPSERPISMAAAAQAFAANRPAQQPTEESSAARDGTDQHGPDQHGPDQRGRDQHGPDQHGPADQHGPDQHGLDHRPLDQRRLDQREAAESRPVDAFRQFEPRRSAEVQRELLQHDRARQRAERSRSPVPAVPVAADRPSGVPVIGMPVTEPVRQRTEPPVEAVVVPSPEAWEGDQGDGPVAPVAEPAWNAVSGAFVMPEVPTAQVEFTPANETETELYDAASGGSTDSYLSTLLLTTVLVPVPADQSAGTAWRTELIGGEQYLVVFTSMERMGEHYGAPTRTRSVPFINLIEDWPDPSWSFAVNPGTPVGATLPGAQIVALATWAAESGLGGEPAEDAADAPAEPAKLGETVPMMQKLVSAQHVAYLLDRAYDRVSGFVHRASEMEHLRTPAELYAAVGRDTDATEAYVLRWPAHRSDLYRIPYGGTNEQAMHAMDGWVIERPPFRGNGFAPTPSDDVIAEFKVDSVRLPHGAQLWRVDADGTERLIALYDSDSVRWRRVGED